MSRPSLRKRSKQVEGEHGVLNFCHSIIAAYRTGAFGGKPALWEFLQDVAKNLNTKKNAHWYSKNNKAFTKAMKIYGGRRMADLFSLNFYSLSYDTISRANKKEVDFVSKEPRKIFQCVADIYSKAMIAHSIYGPILVILSEDDTKVKSRSTWEPKFDTLAGFCGPKDNHVCQCGFKPMVGVG